MRQHQFLRLAVVGHTHCVRELEVFLHGFVSPERTFHQQQRGVFCEQRQIFRKTGVRSIDKQFRVFVFQTQRQTFFRVRRRERGRAQSGQQLEIFVWTNFHDLDREWLFKQTVVIRVVHSVDELAQPCWTTNAQRLRAVLSLRRPFHAEEKGREPTDVIEMKMTDPDGIEIRPVELFLGHAVRRIGARVEQDGAFRSFKPV
jgi:hypothetical protein